MNTLKWTIVEALQVGGINTAKLNELATFSRKIAITLEFGLSLPKSYTNKKKLFIKERLADAHTIKPDLDNLIKNVLDRGSGLLWADDKNIYSISATKKWCEKGYIKIAIQYD